jgi:hypothetical protein
MVCIHPPLHPEGTSCGRLPCSERGPFEDFLSAFTSGCMVSVVLAWSVAAAAAPGLLMMMMLHRIASHRSWSGMDMRCMDPRYAC